MALKFSRVGVLAIVVVVVGLAVLTVVGLSRSSEVNRRARCKENLKQLGLALILYRDVQGRGQPLTLTARGADFLVRLYESGQETDPDRFLCPSTKDDNRRGRLLAVGKTPADACSYAGPVTGWSESGGGSSDRAMVCDDDEGPVRFNHGDALMVLFADGHVEEVRLAPSMALGVGNLKGLGN